MKLNLIKMKLKDIEKLGRQTALITINDVDNEKYKKIKMDTEIKSDIRYNRQYHSHKHLFDMLLEFIDNGGMQKDIIVKSNIGDELLTITEKVITAMVSERLNDYNPELRTLLDICELLFLPKKNETQIDGTVKQIKGSIDYESLSEPDFLIFCDKVKQFLDDNL